MVKPEKRSAFFSRLIYSQIIRKKAMAMNPTKFAATALIILAALFIPACASNDAKDLASFVAYEAAMAHLDALDEMTPAEVIAATRPTPTP